MSRKRKGDRRIRFCAAKWKKRREISAAECEPRRCSDGRGGENETTERRRFDVSLLGGVSGDHSTRGPTGLRATGNLRPVSLPTVPSQSHLLHFTFPPPR